MGREAAVSIDFEAVETAVRRQALRFAARVVEQRLNADHSQIILADLLAHGLWRVQIDWRAGETTYYNEDSFEVE